MHVRPLVLTLSLSLSAFPLLASTARAEAPTPEIFLPGVVTSPANDGSPTFMPDGNTVYFTRSTAGWSVILESHRTGKSWSAPAVAPFSGQWPDLSPALSPDGSYVIFTSLRPTDWQTNPAHPNNGPRRANLYRADRTKSGWSTPTALPTTVNLGPSIWKASVAADGTLYFTVIDKQGKRLYSSAYRAGTYQKAAPLPFSDGTTSDVDPEIAPDGSFLVFCSAARLGGDQKDHLFLVKRAGSGWGQPVALRYAGDDHGDFSSDDEPHLGADHRTLYFSSDRAAHVEFPRTHAQAERDTARLDAWDNSNSNVWSLSLSPWLG